MKCHPRGLVVVILCLCVTAVAQAFRPASVQSPDLAARSRAGSAAMKEGRYGDAVAIYSELVQALPKDPGLMMNLGIALAMAGREADAVAPLERAIAMNPKLLPAQSFLGSSYLSLGEFTKATAPLERAVAGQPADVESRRLLARAYAGNGQHVKAVAQLRRITELAPKLPAAWYALGHGYNALTQDAMATFEAEPPDSPWRRLLVADALRADGRLTDAFALYREVIKELPAMVSIRDAIAAIYEQTDHKEWAAQERAKSTRSSTGCAERRPLCEFRAGRFRAALTAALQKNDVESRYWRVRAANELALAAFKQLDALGDSRERHEMRAAVAQSQRRYVDAVTELQAALRFAPNDPGLRDDLGVAYYAARDFEKAITTLEPLIKDLGGTSPDPRLLTIYGDSLLQLQRVDDALPYLRRAVEGAPTDAMAMLALGRAYIQKGEFTSAVPLIEPHLPEDHDGSLHVQLARAYSAMGQQERSTQLLERSQHLQRAAQERADAVAKRTITPPN